MMVHSTPKQHLYVILLLMVSGLQFFSYLGSVLVTPKLVKSLHGYTSLKTNMPFLVDWVWVTVIGRIIGAYLLCKLTLLIGFFKVMRLLVLVHILLAIAISSFNFTGTLLYEDIQFMFVHRFLHAFFIPASFMLPSLFLLNQHPKNPIILSGYACLSIGLGTLLIYKYLDFVQFYDGWHNVILYASVVSGVCYLFAEKLLRSTQRPPPLITEKLPWHRLFLVCTYAGTCGISFSYHFAFVDIYVKEILMGIDYQKCSFAYYYYALLIAIVPVAKFVYKQGMFMPLKLATLGICLVAILMANTHTITLPFYIVEQLIFGCLAAILLVPCHALVYQLFKDRPNYFEGMFWFVTCFTLFAITPHFFLKLLGVQALPWLGILYLLPIAGLFIVALSYYEKQ